METAKRLVLLLVGLGVAEVVAEEPTLDEKRESPIFAPAPVPVPLSPGNAPEQTPVSRQLAILIRREINAAPPVANGGTNQETAESASGTLQLEKLTVYAKRMAEPPRRETLVEKFTRTGHLWEFSATKRLMIGPNGDKVGLVFSFDW